MAGFVQGGGFGSFSKGFGTGAAGLLEAEIVTADGQVRIVNAATNPDLFWALKGGGGGTFGVVTRLTLMTHSLPETFGAVNADITANSDEAYRTLVERVLTFYRESLMTPHWGEQISFRFRRRLSINMVLQGLDQKAASAVWKPFFDWLAAHPEDYQTSKPGVQTLPARLFWNGAILKTLPGLVRGDDRPDAPKEHFFWAGDAGQVGQVLHAYQSTWLSQALLKPDRLSALVDALVHVAARRGVSLHFNKGLAGAPAEALHRSRDTATNPAVADAFALAIGGSEEGPAYPGVRGHEPNLAAGRIDAASLREAMAPLMALNSKPASYVSETDYFQTDWQTAFWGDNYPRLKAVKRRYDPDGFFFVHHGVVREGWSADGFSRIAGRGAPTELRLLRRPDDDGVATAGFAEIKSGAVRQRGGEMRDRIAVSPFGVLAPSGDLRSGDDGFDAVVESPGQAAFPRCDLTKRKTGCAARLGTTGGRGGQPDVRRDPLRFACAPRLVAKTAQDLADLGRIRCAGGKGGEGGGDQGEGETAHDQTITRPAPVASFRFGRRR